MTRVPQWTGFSRKTLWDWLQLLIVPAILIAVTFAWSATQTRNDNKREDRRITADRAAAEEARRDATLQGYLDQMSGLMLREKLLSAHEGSAVQAVARTVTIAALRRLDGERKVAVVRFLHEAGLLGPNPALDPEVPVFRDRVVSLSGADLRGADFGRADLRQADLTGADLRGVDFRDAILWKAILRGRSTDLRRAQLSDANLLGADLAAADLRGADLRRASLRDAYLFDADLRHADLQGADLQSAGLEGALLGNAVLRGAKGLDLGRYIADLTPKQQKEFLDSQEEFLDSLSPEELAKFNLSPEKLARIK